MCVADMRQMLTHIDTHTHAHTCAHTLTHHTHKHRRFNSEGLVAKCNMMLDGDGIKKGKGAKGKAAVKKKKARIMQEDDDELMVRLL